MSKYVADPLMRDAIREATEALSEAWSTGRGTGLLGKFATVSVGSRRSASGGLDLFLQVWPRSSAISASALAGCPIVLRQIEGQDFIGTGFLDKRGMAIIRNVPSGTYQAMLRPLQLSETGAAGSRAAQLGTADARAIHNAAGDLVITFGEVPPGGQRVQCRANGSRWSETLLALSMSSHGDGQMVVLPFGHEKDGSRHIEAELGFLPADTEVIVSEILVSELDTLEEDDVRQSVRAGAYSGWKRLAEARLLPPRTDALVRQELRLPPYLEGKTDG